jgi:hypothetical protein
VTESRQQQKCSSYPDGAEAAMSVERLWGADVAGVIGR